MATGMQYSIKNNRLKKALCQGFQIRDDSLIVDREASRHLLILEALDSATEDCPWGRLCFDETFDSETVFYVYAFAQNEKNFLHDGQVQEINTFMLDEDTPFEVKKEFMKLAGVQRFIHKSDVLLYELKGRYLWIAIEILGDAGGQLSRLRVQSPGDNFMQAFPEVYQNYGDFFHRYLSVFSTIYNEFQEQIDHRYQLLDLDQAPVELLNQYAEWLGVIVQGEFLSEDSLRALIKEAYLLNKYKGTRKAIQRICEIILGEVPVIVEKNQVNEYIRTSEAAVADRLYGSSVHDVTLLIKGYVDEKKRAQLLYLLRQFKPIRSRIRIVFLQEMGILDSYSYLDVNARTFEQQIGTLDDHQLMDGMVILE